MSERLDSYPGTSPCCNSTLSVWGRKETYLTRDGEPIAQDEMYTLACDECGKEVDWPEEQEIDPPIYTKREFDEAMEAAYQQGCEEGYAQGGRDAR